MRIGGWCLGGRVQGVTMRFPLGMFVCVLRVVCETLVGNGVGNLACRVGVLRFGMAWFVWVSGRVS